MSKLLCSAKVVYKPEPSRYLADDDDGADPEANRREL